AQGTGRQLAQHMRTDPLIQRHAALGNQLLPYALGFGVAVLVLLVAGKLADRERAATDEPDAQGAGNSTVSHAWRRIALVAAVLVVGTAAATTVEVVRIGTVGAQAVWQDVARGGG